MTVTKELIDKIIDGQNAEAADEVIDLLYQKSVEQLDRYKQEYASQLMNPSEEESTEDEQ
jgi:hypothetical protein